MTQTVVAFLSDDGVRIFMVDDDTGAASEGLQTPLSDGTLVLAVVPGQHVLQSNAVLPKISGKRGETAARFAIEDCLAVDPASVHVAVSEALGEDGERLLWATDPRQMEKWVDTLAGSDLEADILLPDYALLPDDGRLHVVEMTWGVAVKSGRSLAATLESGLVPGLLEEVLADGWSGDAVLAADASGRLTPLSGWGDVTLDKTDAPSLNDMASRAASARTELAGANLLQGEFRPKVQVELGWMLWRRPAALAACAALIWVVAVMAEGWRLSAGAEAAYEQADQVLRDTLPGTTRVVNPRAQLRAELATGDGQARGFLEHAAVLTEALSNSDSVRIEALRFDPDNGDLSVTLNYGQYQELEQVSRALEFQGAQVIEGGSRQSGGRVIGELTVRIP